MNFLTAMKVIPSDVLKAGSGMVPIQKRMSEGA
jgi:hypothetical protein